MENSPLSRYTKIHIEAMRRFAGFHAGLGAVPKLPVLGNSHLTFLGARVTLERMYTGRSGAPKGAFV
jgi:hypothetical protein